MGRCRSVRFIFTVMMVALAATWSAPPARGADAVVDAKRRAAAELFKDGKTTDAIALLAEVVRAEPDNYKDHLALARAYDKLNKPTEAASAYHRVLDLLASAQPDDRAARIEADRRLRILEAQNVKVQAAEDEFLKKLEALEREALAAKDATAVRRIFRLKVGVYQATDRRDRGGAEIHANQPWQDTGFALQAGRNYRIRAVGAFQLNTGQECTPDGVDTMSANAVAPLGMLIASVDGKPGYIRIGSSARLLAPTNGHLRLLLNATDAEMNKRTGSVTVLIEQE